MKPVLKLDYCSHEAARLACHRWHYSKKIPVGKTVKIGCWEDDRFIGVLVFGDGLLGPRSTVYGGIDKFKIAEIIRIALREHVHPVSRMIRIAIKLLRRRCPGIELVVAFADQGEGHHGGIYQASGFVYAGESEPGRLYRHRMSGRILHNRAVSKTGVRSHFGVLRRAPLKADCELIGHSRKYRYFYPLTAEMKSFAEKWRKPYPKRAASETIDTSGHQPEEGGEAPTAALHQGCTKFDSL